MLIQCIEMYQLGPVDGTLDKFESVVTNRSMNSLVVAMHNIRMLFIPCRWILVFVHSKDIYHVDGW